MEWDALGRREIAPPFNPCRNQDQQESENFEKEFTTMAIYSVDEGAAGGGAAPVHYGNTDSSETFLNFTFEGEQGPGGCWEYTMIQHDHWHLTLSLSPLTTHYLTRTIRGKFLRLTSRGAL